MHAWRQTDELAAGYVDAIYARTATLKSGVSVTAADLLCRMVS